VVFATSIVQAVSKEYSFISDIRMLNNVNLALLLGSIDLNLDLIKLLEYLFLKVFSHKQEHLEDITADELKEVDSILEKYVTSPLPLPSV
jgi:hypothetical protein